MGGESPRLSELRIKVPYSQRQYSVLWFSSESMAGEPDPIVFQNECNEFPLTEEDDEAAVMRQQLQHREAYGKGVNQRPPIRQQRYKLRSASDPSPPDASVGCAEEGVRKQLSPSTRTHAQADSIGQNTVTAARELPLSSPFVDFDSESKQEPSDRLPFERDGVRKRTIEARHVSALTSQASDSSNQLPLSSSETAEEQGDGSKSAHDGQLQYKPKKGPGGRRSPKRKKSD